jgi:hypothetical protein
MTSNAVSKFEAAGLPSVDVLKKAAAAMRALPSSDSASYLRMEKTGDWVYGTANTQPEEGDKFAVNPLSIKHGWVCWGDGAPLGEVLASIVEPMPAQPADVDTSESQHGWQTVYSVELKGLDGEAKGVQLIYKNNSVGAKKAIQQLALQIADQCDKDPSKPVAVVTLDAEFYKHKKYGRVANPVLTVVDFISMDGPPEAKTETKARRIARK